jgi:hypothetical protein
MRAHACTLHLTPRTHTRVRDAACAYANVARYEIHTPPVVSCIGTYYDENGPNGQAGLTTYGVEARAIMAHPEYTSQSFEAYDAALVFLKSCINPASKATTIKLASATGRCSRARTGGLDGSVRQPLSAIDRWDEAAGWDLLEGKGPGVTAGLCGCCQEQTVAAEAAFFLPVPANHAPRHFPRSYLPEWRLGSPLRPSQSSTRLWLPTPSLSCQGECKEVIPMHARRGPLG